MTTNHNLDVAVIGTGYVGATTAICLANLGNHVIGLDIDTTKIEALTNGHLPLHEPDLEPLLVQALASNRLRFSNDIEAVSTAAVVMLCLPTPPGADGNPDLSYVRAAVTSITPHLAQDAVIVTKSTVPVGTHNLISQWLGRDDIAVVSNPEFLREGSAVDDFNRPDRIVIGSAEPTAAKRVAALYDGIDTTIIHTDPTSAELTKYAANTMLATKLGFINEIARLCDHLDANINDVIAGVGSDHRIGTAFTRPGPGWGGSCFPKDTAGLAHLARRTGVRMAITEAARHSNYEQFEHVISEIERLAARPLHQATIAIWGLAFKAGTDDTRSSPAIEIARRLQTNLATVRAHDPVVNHIDDLDCGPALDICDNADLLVIATEWPQYAAADYQAVARRMRQPVVFDLRNIVPDDTTELAVHRLGRPR